ncbi:Succinate dehydrogenase subunit, mitochondrial [Sesamum angolense]|uniref:Succinate dehydrogenase subunit, mitochondrial n=1 Tax=Sesamum angolense TaxID=2727404 RepID=A0AAE1XAS9_9LAMI|nr:Succinate dehydrogenase subunit, mitochondrial [Sesamum angolense]
MTETRESKSFLRQYWEEYKEFWAERFSFLDNYSRFLHPEKPLPHWDSSVVEEFIASDPIHGPCLKLPGKQLNLVLQVLPLEQFQRQDMLGGGQGVVMVHCGSESISLLLTAQAILWFIGYYSDLLSLQFFFLYTNEGTALSFAFGAVVGGTFGLEIASHWYQLYRLDTMGSQVKFYEWLQNRA